MSHGTPITKVRPRFEGLDVLRGVAVGLVMLGHTWPQTFGGGGIVGVVLFFALSGYLITQLLRRDITAHDRFRWQRFYTHRFFRLFPALALMMMVVSGVALLTGIESVGFVGQSVLIGVFYLADLPKPYFEPIGHFSHLWTLSVEEQFYFVWPWVLLMALRARRVGAVLLTCAVVSLLASAALPLGTNLTAWQIYKSPTSWCIALVLGAGASLYQPCTPALARSWVIATAGAVLAGVSILPHLSSEPMLFLTLGPLVALASAVLVLASSQRLHVTKWEKPLVALGAVSYGAYLWNVPLTLWWRPVGWADLSAGSGLLLIAATLACAVVSWFTVEALGRRGRMNYDQRLASPALTQLPAPRSVDLTVVPGPQTPVATGGPLMERSSARDVR